MYAEHNKQNVVQSSNGREVLMHSTTCTSSENILSSEISYTEINTYCMVPSTWNVQKRQQLQNNPILYKKQKYDSYSQTMFFLIKKKWIYPENGAREEKPITLSTNPLRCAVLGDVTSDLTYSAQRRTKLAPRSEAMCSQSHSWAGKSEKWWTKRRKQSPVPGS